MSVNLLVFVIKWGHFCCHCRCRHCHRRHLCFCCAATASTAATFQTVKKRPPKEAIKQTYVPIFIQLWHSCGWVYYVVHNQVQKKNKKKHLTTFGIVYDFHCLRRTNERKTQPPNFINTVKLQSSFGQTTNDYCVSFLHANTHTQSLARSAHPM